MFHRLFVATQLWPFGNPIRAAACRRALSFPSPIITRPRTQYFGACAGVRDGSIRAQPVTKEDDVNIPIRYGPLTSHRGHSQTRLDDAYAVVDVKDADSRWVQDQEEVSLHTERVKWLHKLALPSRDRIGPIMRFDCMTQAIIAATSEEKIEMLEILDKAISENLRHIGFDPGSNLRDILPDLTAFQKSHILPCLLTLNLLLSASKTFSLLRELPASAQGFEVRMTSIACIWRTHRRELEGSLELRRTFDDYLAELRKAENWPQHHLSPHHFTLLLADASTELRQDLIVDYVEKYPEARTKDLLVIMDHLRQVGDHEASVFILSRISPHDLEESGSSLLYRVRQLLQLDMIETSESGQQSFVILPRVLELGIRADAKVYDVIVQQSIRLGHPGVAMDLFRYMGTEGIQALPRTHLFLLRDALLRSDEVTMNEMLSIIYDQPKLYTNPWLVIYTMNIVRILTRYQLKTSPENAVQRILVLYDRVWHREPLVKLGIAAEVDEKQQSSDMPKEGLESTFEKQIPPPSMLSLVIWTYILIQQSEREVSRVWNWIRHLIAKGDPVIKRVAKESTLYEALLLFYSRYDVNLPKALKVLQFMLDSKLCEPTDRTWSIMMCGFIKHGLQDQARAIRRMMFERGYKMADEGWDHILIHWPESELADLVRTELDETQLPQMQRPEHNEEFPEKEGRTKKDFNGVGRKMAQSGIGPDDLTGLELPTGWSEAAGGDGCVWGTFIRPGEVR